MFTDEPEGNIPLVPSILKLLLISPCDKVSNTSTVLGVESVPPAKADEVGNPIP
jgi:hypothetical protein